MLKESLSLLLSKFYSKQENALISNLAMPQENSVTTIVNEQPVNEWQSVCSFTAPSNGYLLAKGNKTPNAARMNIGIYCGEESIATGSESQNYIGLFIPLRKGAIAGVSANDVRALTVQFFESVGGGYKSIIRRAVLCLSSYSNCFWKPSLNPRNLGSVIRPCRLLLLLHTLMLKGKNGCTLPLLMTDTFTLWQDKQPALNFQQRLYLYCLHRMEENFLNRLSRLRKVVFSGISFMEEPRRTKQRLLSFQSTARCNLNVGGALC